MQRVTWLGLNLLHALAAPTASQTRWPILLNAALAVGLAAIAGRTWARATHQPILGWVAALSLAVLALADWILLAGLPRWGLSFGPVQAPWLALVGFRWLAALLAAYVASRWRTPALAGLTVFQVGIFALLVYGTAIEPFRTQVSRVEVTSTKLADPDAPLRIVQLSDLHVERLTRRERALPALVAGLSPDIIVLTGDYLNSSYNTDPCALADLRSLLSQFHAPCGVYAVWSAHGPDRVELLRPMFAELGITLLEDRAVEVTTGGHRLWLVGLTWLRSMAGDASTLSALLSGIPRGAFTLLLYHTPDLMPQAAALGVDLYLAGHTHGGQWRIPGFGAVLTSSRYWKRYEAGHYRQGNTDLYVSRGLGMEGSGAPRARFFCPPEVVLLELRGAGSGR